MWLICTGAQKIARPHLHVNSRPIGFAGNCDFGSENSVAAHVDVSLCGLGLFHGVLPEHSFSQALKSGRQEKSFSCYLVPEMLAPKSSIPSESSDCFGSGGYFI